MKILKRTLRIILISLGTLFAFMIILAMTPAPFWIRYHMGMKKAGIHRPPDYIVVLGGGGMPSASGFMRCWYGAQAAGYFTRAKVIVTLPGDTTDSLSSVNQMKYELILRGVKAERILVEDSGINTRDEALKVADLIKRHESGKTQNSKLKIQYLKFNIQYSILLVTSPEHLLRAVLTFKKAGFQKVDGIPTFEKDIETNLAFDARRLGGRRFIPDVGKSVVLRYKFWTYLDYETQIAREYVAMGYYWLMGWI